MSIGYYNNTDEKSYYQMLLGQYRLLDDVCKEKAPAAVAVIERIIQKTEQNGAVSWEDVYSIEKALLLFLNREEMECKFLFILDMYREIASDKNLANRIKIKTSALNSISNETLQAELEELVDDLYRHLAVYASCRKSRRKITFLLLLFLIVLFAGAVAWLCTYDGTMPPMFYVIVAGSIGGVISAIRRLQGAADTDANVLTYIDLKYYLSCNRH